MQNRRKTIVINSRFQYQYSLFSVALAVLLVNLFLIIRTLFPGDNPLALTTQGALLIGAIEVIIIGIVWYGSLKQSHRIAGPVYVFNREVGRLCNGDLGAHIRLRDHDMFMETADELNASFATLKDKINRIQGLVSQIPETPENGELLAQLRSTVAEFKEEES